MGGFVITVGFRVGTDDVKAATRIAASIEKTTRETFELEKAYHNDVDNNEVEYVGTFLSKGITSA